ncbi:glycoside hydrolase, partial [Micromonospora sp. NPDC049730]
MLSIGRVPRGAPRRRNWLSRLAVAATALVVGGAAVAVAAAPASAATVDTSAWYVLVNRNSGKALDVYNLATNDGAR